MSDLESGPRDATEAVWTSLVALIVTGAILAALTIMLTVASLLVSAALRP